MTEEIINNKQENGKEKPQNEPNDLKECKQKCDEYLNNWKRERADFLNYKKDEMERIGFLGKYVKENIIFKILPILDNIYLAEKSRLQSNRGSSTLSESGQLPQNSQEDPWTKGFLQIQAQILEFLKKEGIEEIKTIGQKFNPETMEAVAEAESSDNGTTEGSDEGTIIEELQKGYKMNDKVIRPAKVKVTK